MSDIPQPASSSELNEHERSFFSFERLMLFAVLHIMLTLACVALAFIGEARLVGLLFWLAGTLVLLSAFALTRDRSGQN